jgi:hypothetical protein
LVDRAVDQVGAVIGRTISTPGGRLVFSCCEFSLHGGDRLQRILSRAHDHYTADDFPSPFKFGDAAPHFRAQAESRDVAQPHRYAGIAGSQRNLAEVVERFK